MLFGLRNSVSTFQSLIDEVVRKLEFVLAYVDDFLIASSIPDQHLQHLTQRFKHLRLFYVKINPSVYLVLPAWNSWDILLMPTVFVRFPLKWKSLNVCLFLFS